MLLHLDPHSSKDWRLSPGAPASRLYGSKAGVLKDGTPALRPRLHGSKAGRLKHGAHALPLDSSKAVGLESGAPATRQL